MKTAFALLGLILFASPAFADANKLSPEEAAALTAHNRDAVSETPGADGIFAVQPNGDIRHIQSGLMCPARYPNVRFAEAQIYKSDLGAGTDVGCDYRRDDRNGLLISKLTIFAVKAAEGTTLDQAFAKYRGEVFQDEPDAVSEGVAVEDKGGSKTSAPKFRSEEFAEVQNGRKFTSQLFVAVRAGWIVEIRSTFEGWGNTIAIDKNGGVDDAVNAAGDRLMGVKALFDALGTMGT